MSLISTFQESCPKLESSEINLYLSEIYDYMSYSKSANCIYKLLTNAITYIIYIFKTEQSLIIIYVGTIPFCQTNCFSSPRITALKLYYLTGKVQSCVNVLLRLIAEAHV